MSEMEQKEEQLKLKQVTGKAQHIEINERSLEETRKTFRQKGLEVTKHTEYPREDYLIRKAKKFDSIVDPSKGIRKIIESMVRQPVTTFDKTGKAVVKDALYYRGSYRGFDKFGTDIGAPFLEGAYKSQDSYFHSLIPPILSIVQLVRSVGATQLQDIHLNIISFYQKTRKKGENN